MTPADLAKHSAISFECKKDALQQRQSGDWKISFTVQGVDMDERITRAAMGTRFIAVLVEIDDLELPVSKQPEKEVVPNSRKPVSTGPDNAQPQPDAPDKPQPAGAKREWADMLPSAQAAMLGEKRAFRTFLRSTRPDDWLEATQDPAECIRLICGVRSRADLNTNHKARVAWHQLQTGFYEWERVGA